MLKVKINQTAIFFSIIFSLVFFTNCSNSSSSKKSGSSEFTCSYAPTPAGTRSFGMDILDPSTGKTYNDNLNSLIALKGKYQTLKLTWDSIEGTGSGTTSGAFTDPSGALAAFESIAANQGIKLALNIAPVDATGKFVPSDLTSTKFHEGTYIMGIRYKKMLDFVFTKISPANVISVLIGNEIDNYNPGSDSTFWSDYGAFLNDVHYFVANTAPTYSTLKIGFTSTSPGLIDTSKLLALGSNSVQVMKTYATYVDLVGVTYYPLNTDFTVQSTSVVATDFANLADNYSNLMFQEVGYPSSATNNSSEKAQSRFFCEVFRAWDVNSAKIPYLAILRMNDVTLAQAQALAAPYGLSTDAFIQYLLSLGIYQNNGTAKSGQAIIQSELSKRNF